MPQALVWTGTSLHQDALAVLDGLAIVVSRSENRARLWYEEAQGADAVIIPSLPLTGEQMDQIGPQLRIVARSGIGVDSIDLYDATQRGILVVNTPDGPTESTAEHAIALMLSLCKQVMVGDRMLRASRDPQRYQFPPLGFELDGATLGLIGLGRIGGRVAIIANALGMKVLAYDPYANPERAELLGVRLIDPLEDLLQQAQIVSLHCPSTPETRHIINARTLALMPVDSYLINVARGALVDESALFAALQAGQLAGAALDVFEQEPMSPDHPLLTLPNAVFTPHIASYTTASMRRMQIMACEQVAMALLGERPGNLVNPDVWGHHRLLPGTSDQPVL